MNKYVSKVMALGVAGLVIFGMGTPVLAEDTTTPIRLAISDSGQITLQNDYINGSKKQTNTVSPDENFTFTIDRYDLWNVGENGNGAAMYTKENMPTFSNGSTTGATNTFTIHASSGDAGSTTKPFTTLSVPDYDAVGDYWYKVTEADNNVAGVFYGTNDDVTENSESSNGGHNWEYYIHVQVTNHTKVTDTDTTLFDRTVTLHKTAPVLDETPTNAAYESWYYSNQENNGENAKKVSAIQNKYFAGSLNITKNVAGNAADKNELFKVTVKFTNASNAKMNSDIKYYDFYDATGHLTDEIHKASLNWTDDLTNKTNNTKEVNFYVKDGTTVHFDNIPYGVQYSVTETKPSDDKYSHEFAYGEENKKTTADAETTFDAVTLAADTTKAEDPSKTGDDKWNAANATGSISDDLDTVTITNTKTSAIDVGVITSNAPYIAMLAVAGIAVGVYLRKKKMIKE
ncbi:MAG: hypothetical protein PUE27_07230 [Sharpea porci]|uniref:DUF7601 domain-containing protein n=1 Tax=Sharpea porci TaxID=2652286 RepID=UPI00240A88D3|nr:hypothetical protein [Sharpea porci]MDD6711855.1 hypothetical protein [Sharpea porci]